MSSAMHMITCLDYSTPCVPPTATAQQKGAYVGPDGHVRFFTKANVRQAENAWYAILRPARDAFGPALTGPVACDVTLVYPYRRSERKRDTACGDLLPLDRRPDADNLGKALLDCIGTLGFWTDDAQVFDLRICKFRGPAPYFRLALSVPEASPTSVGRTPIIIDRRAGR